MTPIPLKHYIFDYNSIIPVGEQITSVHVVEGILAGRHPHCIVLNERHLSKWKSTITTHLSDTSYFSLCHDNTLTFEGQFNSRAAAEHHVFDNDPNDNVAWIIDPATARQILAAE